MDVWMAIKVLNNRGVGVRQIAKQIRINKNMVRKYLRTYDLQHYDKTGKYGAKSKCEGLKKEIIEMYYNKRFVGSRIFEELKKRGAELSRTGFYTYLQKIKREDLTRKIRER